MDKRKRDIIIGVFDPLLNLIVDFLFTYWHARRLQGRSGPRKLKYFVSNVISDWPHRFGNLLLKLRVKKERAK